MSARKPIALLLGVVLLTTGCVTLAPRPGGSGSQGPRALASFRETAASTPPLQRLSPVSSTEPGGQELPHRRADVAVQGPPTCGGQAVPPGWPDFSSDGEELLAPFLSCTSPAEFVALQQRVDMPRLVEALDDWHAVRLGALGPVREDAAPLLQRKRVAFLLSATERYGLFHAEVFALFFKSRNLALLEEKALAAQMMEDAREALRKYGETLDIRRDSLRPLLRESSEVPVSRVRLIYEGGELKPRNVADMDAVVNAVEEAVPGVEVMFQ